MSPISILAPKAFLARPLRVSLPPVCPGGTSVPVPVPSPPGSQLLEAEGIPQGERAAHTGGPLFGCRQWSPSQVQDVIWGQARTVCLFASGCLPTHPHAGSARRSGLNISQNVHPWGNGPLQQLGSLLAFAFLKE